MHDENYLIKGDTLEDIADAIRYKKQSQETIAVSDFADEIENLPSGGDFTEYFYESITGGQRYYSTIKKIPAISNTGTSCSTMFIQCTASEIDLSNFNTSNVTTMYQMFMQCTELKKLDMNHLDTSKVTDMRYMFDGCSKLTELKININVGAVGTMIGMFGGCTGLTTLDLSNWEFKQASTISDLFLLCTNLTHIDFRSADFSITYSSGNPFGSSASNGVPDDCEIIVKDNTQKTWFSNNHPRLTNVKTVAEYETQ